MERYFYHSFPRRRTDSAKEIDKGCQILASIRDFGLLLMPEQIEWSQPLTKGEPPRIFPVLQKRICFTELSPSELPQHAEKFGHFALEFEIDSLRRLGAIPVFYLPQPTDEGLDGNAVGIALLGVAMDASTVISRLACLDRILNGPTPVAEQLNFNTGFTRTPEQRGNFTLNSAEAKNLLRAVGYATTPWAALNAGISSLLNFFYPTDNVKHDKLLEYYRQREWRIACAFCINGIEILRVPMHLEKERCLQIDPEFFGRQIKTEFGLINAPDLALVHPGLKGTKIIEMVRRVVVPTAAIDHVTSLLAKLAHPPQIISIDALAA